jgi:hypothetical protein
MLEEYGVVIVDEVHESSINTDILVTLLKKIAKTNKTPFKLKLIILPPSSAPFSGRISSISSHIIVFIYMYYILILYY